MPKNKESLILCRLNIFLIGEMSEINYGIEKINNNQFKGAAVEFSKAYRKYSEKIFSLNIDKNSCQFLNESANAALGLAWYYISLALDNRGTPHELLYSSSSFGIIKYLTDILEPALLKSPSVNSTEQMNEIIKSIDAAKTMVSDLISDGLTSTLRKDSKRINIQPILKKVIRSVEPDSIVVRDKSVQLCQNLQQGDFKQARKLYEYVRDEIKYIKDPSGFDFIQKPEITMKLNAGDCEDKAILLASLLMAISFEAALIFVDTDNDGTVDHVYNAVYIENAPDYCKPFPTKILPDGKDIHHWIPLDSTLENLDFGVIPEADYNVAKFIPISVLHKTRVKVI